MNEQGKKMKKIEVDLQRSVFIPLKKEYFNLFASGEKDTEYRRYGSRWNEQVCQNGRAITLSCGYGKSRRLNGVIISVSTIKKNQPSDFKKIYGENEICFAIKIKLNKEVEK